MFILIVSRDFFKYYTFSLHSFWRYKLLMYSHNYLCMASNQKVLFWWSVPGPPSRTIRTLKRQEALKLSLKFLLQPPNLAWFPPFSLRVVWVCGYLIFLSLLNCGDQPLWQLRFFHSTRNVTLPHISGWKIYLSQKFITLLFEFLIFVLCLPEHCSHSLEVCEKIVLYFYLLICFFLEMR